LAASGTHAFGAFTIWIFVTVVILAADGGDSDSVAVAVF
jgi:hypothetical protein